MTRLPLLTLAIALCPALAQLQPVETSSRRGTVCLNGAWRFQPAVGAAATAPVDAWGEALVPGAWAGSGPVPGLTRQGQGPTWSAVPAGELGRGWYERAIEPPAAWQGRSVVLELTRVSTDAVVFCNEVPCGGLSWPRGEVDITKGLRFGAPNTLRVLVVATAKAEDAAAALAGAEPTWRQAGPLAARGIVGEAFLHSRPTGAHIADVFCKPSVRGKKLDLEVTLQGTEQAGPAKFTARLLDKAGQVAKTFTGSPTLTAAASQTLNLSWPWADPVLWDVGRPNLYTLQLAVTAPGLDDEYPRVFGFREFRIDGLRFLLNEREIRLRPVCLRDEYNSAAWVPQAIDNTLDAYAAAGFNFGEHWPGDEDERGTVVLRGLWAEAADRKGFLLAGASLSANPYLYGPNWRFVWPEPGIKERFEQRLAAHIAPLRNHPSIVMWGTSANMFGRQQDQNPLVIGRRGWYAHDDKARAGLESVAILRRHDPTRPIFTHHGADVGDLHTCNNYLDLTPLQEREEWLSDYVAHGQMPYLPIEFGTPLHTTFMRGRNGFGDAVVSEPLMTEFCAIYLGERAYDLETDAYRARLTGTYEAPDRWRNWHNAPELEQAPAFQEVQKLFVTNTWRSWRTWGLTAGMVPWSMAHGWGIANDDRYQQVDLPRPADGRGAWFPRINTADLHYLQPEGKWTTAPAGQALIDNNSATLAYIAGSPERFVAKDHHYEAGSELRKQIVLINDGRASLGYHVDWRIRWGGQTFALGTSSGRISPATTTRLPLSVSLPTPARNTDCEIEMTARLGEQTHRDRFPFRLYAARRPEPPLSVMLFDPRGETTKLLAGLGVVGRPWYGRPGPGQVLVVGQRALEETPPGPLATFVAFGGRLVIMGQTPQCLREQLGLRVARQVSRRFWPVASEARHPIVAGLDGEDLRDWNGDGALVPTAWGGLAESPNADPPYGWHWGNTGSVASAAVEKPHLSGWRPLLEGEFDLAYSPLLELHHGRGLALLCTLDLEGRTKADPVADRLARQIIRYAQMADIEPRATRTVYLGGPAGARLLRGLGLNFEPATALPARAGLAVIGSDADLSAGDLRAFAQRGGRALLLPRATPLLGQLGATTSYRETTALPDWPELRGLSRSDLRLRGAVPMAPVLGDAEVVSGAGGLLGRALDGRVLLLQLTPDALPAQERTYLRYSRWRLTRALTQILANLGAEFAMDAKSLTPGWNSTLKPVGLAGTWQMRVEKLLPAATDPNARTQDPGQAPETVGWSAAKVDAKGWTPFKLPAMWETAPGVGEHDGSFWVRREVLLPEAWAGRELVLRLGPVDDRDTTWFNGVKVGEGSGWNVPRSYLIPPGLAKAGVNSIAIRVFDEFGGGGWSCRPEEMLIGPYTPPATPEGEILANPAFADGAKGWSLSVMGGAAATMAVTDEVPAELLGQKSVRIDVTKASDTAWHVQFGQPGISLQGGVQYVWTAWVKASAPCSVKGCIEKAHAPYGSAGLFERINLTPEWQHLKLTFRAPETDAVCRFTLEELAGQVVTYHLAAPSFTVQPEPGQRRAETTVASFYHPDYVEGQALGDDPYRYYRW